MTTLYFLLLFSTSFFLTAFVECGFAFILFKSKEMMYSVFLCNLLTNPISNLILVQISDVISPQWYIVCLAFMEIGIVIIEAFIMRILCDFNHRKALQLSILFNSASLFSEIILYFCLFFI